MNNYRKYFDLCIAIDWDFDWEFIHLLEQKAKEFGLNTYIVHSKNLHETITLVEQDRIKFGYFFDRASDTSPEFLAIRSLIRSEEIPVFESLKQLQWASDKATMHLEFISQGLKTPYTIILPPFNESEKVQLSIEDLAKLGRPFIIKPANTTGGGIGVVDGAETLIDVLAARQEFLQDKYLLQEKVIPLEQDGKRFWFRGIFACGLVQCAWWNDLSNIYELLQKDQKEQFQLTLLFDIVMKIADICKLKFFSTEIVVNTDREFIIVDYVNESPDMRFQSSHHDGVPDEMVYQIASNIIFFIMNTLKKQRKP